MGKVVQLFALTRWDKSVIIDHKFIKHCDEKEEYLRRIFREPSVGVRRESEPEKGTLEQYFHKRGLMQPVSVNEGGTAEDF